MTPFIEMFVACALSEVIYAQVAKCVFLDMVGSTTVMNTCATIMPPA